MRIVHRPSSGLKRHLGTLWMPGGNAYRTWASRARYEMHTYPGTQHGFHNDSTPRYNEAAAKLAWERTIAFFRKNLA
jgi:dienelactone hydrolase